MLHGSPVCHRNTADYLSTAPPRPYAAARFASLVQLN